MARRGGQPGNQNARKHGFYSNNLDAAAKQDYRVAIRVEGLEPDLALLRVKLHRLITAHPDRPDLLIAGVRAVVRLINDRDVTEGGSNRCVSLAICSMLNEVAAAAGIDAVLVPADLEAGPGVDGDETDAASGLGQATVRITAQNDGKPTETNGNQAQNPDPPRSVCFPLFHPHVKFQSAACRPAGAARGRHAKERPASPLPGRRLLAHTLSPALVGAMLKRAGCWLLSAAAAICRYRGEL